jgi:hypothetical protein
MEKILFAVNAINPSRKVIEFACYLGRLTRSKVTAVLLENLVAEEELAASESRGISLMKIEPDQNSDEYKTKIEMINRNINLIREACTNGEVSCNVHRDRGVPARELLNETRFADVLVLDGETSFNKYYEETPTGFVKNILENAECPAIMAPDQFDGIDEIVFAYNGSSSSVFAIKQFTYLFPQLRDNKITITRMSETGEWQDKDKYKFKEWLKNHYADLHFEGIKGNSDGKLFDYLFRKKKMFLVMGAYGRNALSQFFKRSHADLLIRTVTQPIFIAHL